MPRRFFKHRTIAVVYDFDGTLSPLPMQEYTVLPQIGISAKRFWGEVKKENEKIEGEVMITYMMKMLELSNQKNVRITRKDLKNLGKLVRYFPGVKGNFTRINRFVKRISKGRVRIRHYLISAGLEEILEGSPIRRNFHRIYASSYFYDQYGAAKFPKLVITDTVKTQFLFRINKGKEKLSENVNEHMPEADRPIPFSNILYIGDSLTDVPSMTVTTKNGGYAIAVYSDRKGLEVCKELFRVPRVDFIARADYREGSELDRAIKMVLHTIIQGILFQESAFRQYIKYATAK